MRVMMNALLLAVFAWGGCDETASVSSLPAVLDGGVQADMVPIPQPHYDMAGNVDLQPKYNPCVMVTQTPVTSGSEQAQACLTNENCVDSLGHTYVDSLYDSCHQIYCQWKLACNNGNPKMFCLPDNEQSSPEYADDSCTIPIALVAVKNNKPVSQYVGLDKYRAPDGGGFGDGGADYCVDDYTIGMAWEGNTVYVLYGGMCNPTFLDFPGVKLYYLSADPVDPSLLFVEQ